MKFICSKAVLAKGVNTVLKAVSAKSTIPILQCILVEAAFHGVKLTANNTELGIETMLDAEVIEPGTVALDAKIFSEIVRKLPDNEVTVSCGLNYITEIRCGKTKLTIAGLMGEDFERLPYVERRSMLSVSELSLREVIRQTIFSIAENDSNRMMMGELFEMRENRLRVVSLDGHRISVRCLNLKENYGHYEVIVPGKTLQELAKILEGGADNMVDMYVSDSYILFEFGRIRVVSRVVEGTYFPIDQMMSGDYNTKVVVNRRELIDCLDRASLLVREGDRKPIVMDIRDDCMALSIRTAIGSMNDELDIRKEGEDLLIGFNTKFFLDALRVLEEEEVAIYLSGRRFPCYIRDEADTYNYMILPVNFVV